MDGLIDMALSYAMSGIKSSGKIDLFLGGSFGELEEAQLPDGEGFIHN